MIDPKKYDYYLPNEVCKRIQGSPYKVVIDNIIADDESYITETMKIEFFTYIEAHDGIRDLIEYCNEFFWQPKAAPLDKKKYLLKGRVVGVQIHNKDVGRVVSKKGFVITLNAAMFTTLKARNAAPFPPSHKDDESILDMFLISYEDSTSITDQTFIDFLKDSGIANCTVQEHIMWTFDGFFDDDVHRGYDISDLPCILGLPGPDGTEKNYMVSTRITYALRIPMEEVEVRKPTCFDAGMSTVWRLGGKTKTHRECEAKYGSDGFEEYVHKPIDFKYIASGIYKV